MRTMIVSLTFACSCSLVGLTSPLAMVASMTSRAGGACWSVNWGTPGELGAPEERAALELLFEVLVDPPHPATSKAAPVMAMSVLIVVTSHIIVGAGVIVDTSPAVIAGRRVVGRTPIAHR